MRLPDRSELPSRRSLQRVVRVKEPSSPYPEIPTFLYSAAHRRRRSHRREQRIRAQQWRLGILSLGLLGALSLGGLALWNLGMAAQSLLAHVTRPQVTDTREITRTLARDFGPVSFADSPLYQLPYRTPPSLLAQSISTPSTANKKLQPLSLAQEDAVLKRRIEQIFASYGERFNPHFYYYNPHDGTYVQTNGYRPVAAASVIKLPLLVHYLMTTDQGLLTAETPLLYADFHRTGEAGELQHMPTGQVFSARRVASDMIRISDNTSTNMMLWAVGGTDAFNQQMAWLGLHHTRIRNRLPDVKGTNTISAYEMATLLYNLDQGTIVSEQARTDGLDILTSTRNRRLLVWQLPNEVTVSHKTGDIGISLGDSGIVYLPDGRRYYISIQVERPFNDYAARDMIQEVSRAIYDHVASQDAGTLANNSPRLMPAPPR